MGLFSASHGSAFSKKIAAPFPALSILTILHAKCQPKSFKDMNILIKPFTFLENSFVQENVVDKTC